MTVAIQIRDVPEDVRDTLAELAAAKGQSMQAYLLDMVGREARMARNAEAFDRLAPYRAKGAVADEIVAIIREGRDGGAEVDRDDYT